jgi:hypothetical protein
LGHPDGRVEPAIYVFALFVLAFFWFAAAHAFPPESQSKATQFTTVWILNVFH